MRKINSRMIGLGMLILVIAFVLFALNHPEASFPWSNTITYGMYCIYVLIMLLLLAIPRKR